MSDSPEQVSKLHFDYDAFSDRIWITLQRFELIDEGIKRFRDRAADDYNIPSLNCAEIKLRLREDFKRLHEEVLTIFLDCIDRTNLDTLPVSGITEIVLEIQRRFQLEINGDLVSNIISTAVMYCQLHTQNAANVINKLSTYAKAPLH